MNKWNDGRGIVQREGPKPPRVKRSNSHLKSARIPRNEKCFCGSGKKYKHCHGAPAATNAVKEKMKDGFEFIQKVQSGAESNPTELIRSSDSVPKQ